jgi:pyrroline-5-carboxylate reductase
MVSDTLGIIGFGNMGSAIVGGLLESHLFEPHAIHVYDPDPARVQQAKAAGHLVYPSIGALTEKTRTLVLAVKPKDMHGILHELGKAGDYALVISIAAGITTRTIQEALKTSPVVRAMPNAPCMTRTGATVVARGKFVHDSHVELAKRLLGAVGYVVELPESLMDAVTGLSGSGPAYVALLVESLADGGVRMGLPRQEALRLALETVRGTAAMILASGLHPAQLRDMVASPGGTTIEGLAALEKGAFRSSVMNAVEAAAKRSKELGQ